MQRIYHHIKNHSHIQRVLKNKHFKKWEKYASLIIWMAAIYYLSNKSLEFLGGFDLSTFVIRKIAHMFEFAVLTLLVFRILNKTDKKSIHWEVLGSFIFAVLYAISDEYHQSFVSGRIGTYRDVIVDTLGILAAIWLIMLDFHHRKILESKHMVAKIEKIIKRTK